MMKVLDGQFGKGGYKVEFKEGKLCVEVLYDAGALEGGLTVKLDAAEVLDVLAKAIPGHIDDAILATAKGLLKGVSSSESEASSER
jgi:hypothetical protein